MKKMIIDGRTISRQNAPYIIAEMSANHNGDIEKAFAIISAAKKAGASAVKMQTYTADTLTLDSRLPDFMINGGLWDGQSLYELYQSAYTPWAWHKPLFEHAKKQEITIFSSPFDNSAVDLLEDLNAPAYKIASFEVVDLELIKYAASTGKPLIMSTGMATKDEIGEAVSCAREAGCQQLAILHCVSGYPSPVADCNLATITDMAETFGLLTGLSDHSLSNGPAVASVALGACIIEKHFTLDRLGGGADDSFSMEPKDLEQLVALTSSAHAAIGTVGYQLKQSEVDNIKFRRSLYFVKALEVGEIITRDSVRSIRPGYGMLPKMLPSVLGSKVMVSVQIGTPVTEDVIDKA